MTLCPPATRFENVAVQLDLMSLVGQRPPHRFGDARRDNVASGERDLGDARGFESDPMFRTMIGNVRDELRVRLRLIAATDDGERDRQHSLQ